MFDRYCENENCPICGSKMIDDSNDWRDRLDCPNDCYCILYNPNVETYYVFNKSVQLDDLEKTINYWRENDRYLVNILSA